MTNYQIWDLANIGNSLAYYTETSGANTIEYFCTPWQPWDALSASSWKIMRMTTVTATGNLIPGKCIMFAGGTPSFSYAATDLATVKWYTYS